MRVNRTLRRSKLEILTEILELCSDQGLLKTQLVYRANSNFNHMTSYLDKMRGLNLIIKKGDYYVTSEKGVSFLNKMSDALDLLYDNR